MKSDQVINQYDQEQIKRKIKRNFFFKLQGQYWYNPGFYELTH